MSGIVTPPAPTNITKIIAQSGTPIKIWGNGSAKTFVSFTVPANTIPPGARLIVEALLSDLASQVGGATLRFSINATNVFSATIPATTASAQLLGIAYVDPSMKAINAYTGNFNGQNGNTDATTFVAWTTLAARASSGPFPYAGSGSNKSILTTNIDFTADSTFSFELATTSVNSQYELSGFSVRYESMGAPRLYVSPLAVAAWGDSLTAGTGSGAAGGLVFTRSATTNGTTTLTVTVAAGVNTITPNMMITGTGIPVGTVVVSVGTTDLVMSQAATNSATNTMTFTAGSWESQFAYQSPGRAYYNGGVGGENAAQITTRVLRDDVRGALWNPVFWMGRNNVGSPTMVTEVMSSLQTCTAQLSSGVVPIILTVTSGRGEPNGNANNTLIQATNAAIMAAYPNNYVDVYSLVCTNNGALADAYACYVGGTQGANEVHMNDYAYSIIAAAVLAKRIALGV